MTTSYYDSTYRVLYSTCIIAFATTVLLSAASYVVQISACHSTLISSHFLWFAEARSIAQCESSSIMSETYATQNGSYISYVWI